MSEKRIVVISGPSGSGESSITRELVSRYPDQIERLITATSRPIRSEESDGVDYVFLGKEGFQNAIECGDILEYGYIPNRDVYYGSYRPQLNKQLATGRVLIANTQIVGTRFYKHAHDALTIFIVPGSMEELAGRIHSRSPELSEEEVHKRLEDAQREVDEEGPEYDYHVTNANGKFDEAVDQVLALMHQSGYNM